MDMSAWIGRSLGNDGIVVDIGGGPGHLGYWMKNHYPEIQVIHTDYSHDALVFGRKMYPHEAIQLSAKNIPFPNDFAHGVLFADVLEHLDPDSASQALAESYRILKEGGHLFINIPNRITWSRKTFFEPSHLWIPTIRDMITAVKKHGFEAIDVSTRGFPWSTMLRSWTGNDLHLPVGGTSIFLHATKA
jgi:ubiquinone/menaquinone biosynthesis C-methylase UbiE